MVAYYAKRAAEHDHIYDLPERQGDIRKRCQLCQTRFAGLEVLEVSCGRSSRIGWRACMILRRASPFAIGSTPTEPTCFMPRVATDAMTGLGRAATTGCGRPGEVFVMLRN